MLYLLGSFEDQAELAALYTKALMKHPKSRTWMTKVISLIFGVCLLFGAGGTSADDTKLHRSDIDTDKLLCWAAGNGDIFQVKLMLSLGADTSHMEEGVTALMRASFGGYRDIVQLLMNNGSDIHLKNVAGTNALMFASMEGHGQIVDLLLRRGARVNDKDSAGQTAIFQASVSGSIETVRLLIAAGADLKVKNKLGITALDAATKYGGNAGIVKLLRESTAVDEKFGNSNSVDSNNKGLPKATLHEVTVADDIEAVRKLISNGADINMRDEDGFTSLMHASYAGYDG